MQVYLTKPWFALKRGKESRQGRNAGAKSEYRAVVAFVRVCAVAQARIYPVCTLFTVFLWFYGCGQDPLDVLSLCMSVLEKAVKKNCDYNLNGIIGF